MAEYPECDKMLAVHELSQAIGEFIEWLPSVGMRLAQWEYLTECHHGWISLGRNTPVCTGGRLIVERTGEDDGECPYCLGTGQVARSEPILVPITRSIESLLALHFDIDLVKVDDERRAMIDALRRSNDG